MRQKKLVLDRQFFLKFTSLDFVLVLTEVDDVAEYLDHLLAIPQQSPISATKGGLNRFRAAVNKTREMVSLVHKAKGLNIHSEFNLTHEQLHLLSKRTLKLTFILFCSQMCVCISLQKCSMTHHQSSILQIKKSRYKKNPD